MEVYSHRPSLRLLPLPLAWRQLRRQLALACLPLALITASPPLALAQWRSASGPRPAYGNGYRPGNGWGYGNGYRPGNGWGYGNGYRPGNGWGYGNGYRNGYGYGYGYRPGYGWGNGYPNGWVGGQPWNYGWYGSVGNGWNPGWGWWGGSSAFWGISSLATSAIIGGLVNNSIRNQQQTIVVPNSTYQLVYGSVRPTDNSNIEFRFNYQGRNYQATADCRQGWLNGQQPTAPAEAELLNAACQMAFGSLSR